MALIACPECGRQLSDRAICCPDCACPISAAVAPVVAAAPVQQNNAEELKKLGFDVIDSSANFIFAAPGFMGGAEYLNALRARNILVRHWNSERIRDYVRITVGTMEQMETLVEVTKELMK